jgi:hypothetical protein
MRQEQGQQVDLANGEVAVGTPEQHGSPHGWRRGEHHFDGMPDPAGPQDVAIDVRPTECSAPERRDILATPDSPSPNPLQNGRSS